MLKGVFSLYACEGGTSGTLRRKTMNIENDIEKHLKKQITKIGGLCFKFVSPGTRGVPDRIILYKGETCFVELKRPGGKVRKDQQKMAQTFQKQQIPIYVLDTKIAVDHFVLKLKVGDLKSGM